MARTTAIALVVVVIAGVAGVLVVAARVPATTGVDLGVPAGSPIAVLKRGQEICQGPLALDDDVRAAEFTPAPGGRRGPALEVELRTAGVLPGEPRVLARTRVPSEVMTGGPRRVDFAPAGREQIVDFCVRSAGRERVEIWGDLPAGRITNGRFEPGSHPTLRPSGAMLDGKLIEGEVFARFPGPERTALAEAPTLVERLSRFRAPFFGPAVAWLLLGTIAIGGPLALFTALRASVDRDAA